MIDSWADAVLSSADQLGRSQPAAAATGQLVQDTVDALLGLAL